MSDRPHGPTFPSPTEPRASRSRAGKAGRRSRAHRVGKGMPSYRPVRSPLVSMGPSLLEERRRRKDRTLLLAAATIVAAGVVALVALVTLLGHEVVTTPEMSPPVQPLTLPVGPPEDRALAWVAAQGNEPRVRLQLPIARKAITGIGYNVVHDAQVLVLEPEGARANLSFGQRLFRRLLDTGQSGGLRYYMLASRGEPRIINVGAAPGTDVYAPLSGTVIAIADNVLNDESMGVVVQIQPLGDPETVVVMSNIDAAPQLEVGGKVSERTTLIGYVRDVGSAQQQPLARYTHDTGTSLEMYVRRVESDSIV